MVSSSDKVDNLAFLLEEQDSNTLGLNVVWIQKFDEIAQFLRNIRENQAKQLY